MLMPASGSCTQRARWREIVGGECIQRRGGEGGTGEGVVGTGGGGTLQGPPGLSGVLRNAWEGKACGGLSRGS